MSESRVLVALAMQLETIRQQTEQAQRTADEALAVAHLTQARLDVAEDHHEPYTAHYRTRRTP